MGYFYLGIFGPEFQKIIVIFEISTHEFVKNMFGKTSAFFKGPGSAFTQGLGQDPLFL